MWATICRAFLLGLGAVVCVAAAACGGGTTGGSTPGDSNPPVPSNVQQAIHDKYGNSGFVPSKMPSGYSFRTWSGGATGFDIYFESGNAQEIGYDVSEEACSAAGTSLHTFPANGVDVAWSGTYADQQAWRCLSVDGKQFVITASRSVSGDNSLDTSSGMQDAQQLADVVAYAQVVQ